MIIRKGLSVSFSVTERLTGRSATEKPSRSGYGLLLNMRASGESEERIRVLFCPVSESLAESRARTKE